VPTPEPPANPAASGAALDTAATPVVPVEAPKDEGVNCSLCSVGQR